ncbi:hypothetical protein ABG067_006231 [Albugo candida]
MAIISLDALLLSIPEEERNASVDVSAVLYKWLVPNAIEVAASLANLRMSLLSWMTRRKMKNGGAVTQSTDETSYDKHFSSQVRVLIEIRAAFGLYFACCCQCTFTLINLPVRFYYELRQVRPCSASLAYTLVKISIPSSCLVDPRVLVLVIR